MERKSTKLDTIPIIVSKQCLLESFSETINDNQAIIFLEYQKVTGDNNDAIGHTAIISVVDSKYLDVMLGLHAQITGKKEFLDVRKLTWQEIKDRKNLEGIKVIKVVK
jgi:hypothetical protein